MSQTFDPTAIRERLDAARTEISQLCRGPRDGGHDWRMCIPVQESDSDRVLARALDDTEALLAEVERLRATMERAFRDAVDTPANAESILGYALYGEDWETR